MNAIPPPRKGGKSRFYVGLIMMAIAILVTGCFSSGTRVTDDPIRLSAEPDVQVDPDTGRQIIKVRAVTSRGEPAHLDFEQAEILGVTADGMTVPISPNAADGPVKILVTGQTMYDLDELNDVEALHEEDGLILSIDAESLLAQGITQIKLVVGSYMLIIDIQPYGAGPSPNPDPDPDPSPEPDPDPDPTPEPDPGTGPDPKPEPDPDPVQPPSQTREVRTLRRGTSQATPAYIIRSHRSGPTVMIVGGVHGGERAGWMAAGEIKDWQIDRGTLVVVPEANRPAVERVRRTGTDGVDLNRQFPVGSTPRTALAREIWNLVLEFRPVALMDLHEGWGLRRLGHRFPGGTLSVGQTIITYPAKDAQTFAKRAAAYVDQYHVLDLPTYSYMTIGPPVAGSLARKAGADLGIPAFIVEPSQEQTLLATRIRWHKAFVDQLLKWYGLIDENRVVVPKEYRAQGPGSFNPGDGFPEERNFRAA